MQLASSSVPCAQAGLRGNTKACGARVGVQDAGVARAALSECRDELAEYRKCNEKHLSDRQREIVLAPQVYRDQAQADALKR